MERKTYLGDSVYAESVDTGVVLTTENGMGPSNTIFLEPEVLDALFRWVEGIKKRKETNAA